MLRDAVVERDSAVSLHVQLRNAIAANIRMEKLAVGDRLPSERELQQQFELSRMTVRQALADLARSGMVYSKPGKGTFVAPRQVQRSGSLATLRDSGRRFGFEVASKLLEQTTIPASPEDAETLQIAAGSDVLVIKRIRLVDGVPFAIETAHLPLDLCGGLIGRDLENGSLHETLRSLDLAPVRAKCSFGHGLPRDEEIDLLGLERDRPSLRTRWISFLANGTPIENVHSVLRSESYEFDVSIDH